MCHRGKFRCREGQTDFSVNIARWRRFGGDIAQILWGGLFAFSSYSPRALATPGPGTMIWQTLPRSQQHALARSIAGSRQDTDPTSLNLRVSVVRIGRLLHPRIGGSPYHDFAACCHASSELDSIFTASLVFSLVFSLLIWDACLVGALYSIAEISS